MKTTLGFIYTHTKTAEIHQIILRVIAMFKYFVGYQDLIINGDFKTSVLYWNNGDGTFTDATESSGVGTDENGMGSTVADYDLDGRQDWFLSSIHMSAEQMEPFREVYLGGGIIFGHTGNRLYRFVTRLYAKNV